MEKNSAWQKNIKAKSKDNKLGKNICSSYHIQRVISLLFKGLVHIDKKDQQFNKKWAKNITDHKRENP